jgi:hypothetical protein
MTEQNAHQIADWNGQTGERWVANQARLDAMLAVFGQAAIEAGIKKYLEMLGPWVGEPDEEDAADKAMAILSTMVGAMVLSRAVNNKRLSKRLLQAAAKDVLAKLSTGSKREGSLQ